VIPRPLGPTEDSADGAAARKLADVIGSALQAKDGTAAGADLLAYAGALADADASRAALLDEAFVDTAYDLLAEHERAYGLPVQPDLAPADRRARLTAKVRAARAATPDAILLAVRALDPTATLFENTPATIPPPTDPAYADSPASPVRTGADRLVFLWAVRLAVAVWNDASLRARIDALLDQMQPAHTNHSLHTNDPAAGFLFNDPSSLFGRDAFFTP
jgi:hypothetical protein